MVLGYKKLTETNYRYYQLTGLTHMKIQIIEKITVSQISDQNEFDINRPYYSDSLEKSIQKNGVISPLSAYTSDDKYFLIDGFQRYRIAKKYNISTFPIIIYNTPQSMEKIIELRYNLITSVNDELNVLQKARFYNLVTNYVKEPLNQTKWLNILNLPRDNSISKINTWSENACLYLIKYNVSYNQIKFFFNLSTDDITFLFNLALSLSIRPVEFLKLSEWLNEYALNENISIKTVLQSNPITCILSNDEINRNQKIVLLKDAIYSQRYPVISEYRHKMETLNKQISTAGAFTVNYDKTFERSGIQLQAAIKNEKDIKKLRESLDNSATIETLIKMLKLI